MGRVANVTKRPFSLARQAWKDYRRGRMIRKNGKKDLGHVEYKETEEINAESQRFQKHKPAVVHTIRSPHHQTTEPPARTGWQLNWAAEFPWRLQQIVVEESNWRGTWVLEVKDMQGMDWGTVEMPKDTGRGIKYHRRPTKQLPFMAEKQQSEAMAISDGGQDDLMVWLGKR